MPREKDGVFVGERSISGSPPLTGGGYGPVAAVDRIHIDLEVLRRKVTGARNAALPEACIRRSEGSYRHCHNYGVYLYFKSFREVHQDMIWLLN